MLQQATVRDLRAAIKPQMARPVADLQVNLSPHISDDIPDQEILVNATPRDADNIGSDAKRLQSADEIEVTSEGGSETGGGNEAQEDDMVGATRWQKQQRRKERLLAEQQRGQKPVVENEKQAGRDTTASLPKDTKDKSKRGVEEKPLSKAERRKKIKAEIIAAGQGETFDGYRRRMW